VGPRNHFILGFGSGKSSHVANQRAEVSYPKVDITLVIEGGSLRTLSRYAFKQALGHKEIRIRLSRWQRFMYANG
jgi:hypothetical protein